MTPITIIITCDDGSGMKEHTFKIPVTPKQKQALIEQRPAPTQDMDEAFLRFLVSGDISEIQAMPDHRQKFKPYVFVQINAMKGRTLYAAKPTRINTTYVGILAPNIWPDDFVKDLSDRLKNGVINAVIFDNGAKPALILDMAIDVDEWSSRGRLLNSLYRMPKNYD